MSDKSTPAVKLVRVYHANRGEGSFIHGEYRLDKGGYADVPADVAQLWKTRKHNGLPAVVERIEEATPAQVKTEQENADLKAKNEDLLTRLANLEKLVEEQRANAGKPVGGPTVPVVEDIKPGESPTGSEVLKGAALKEAQEKQAKPRK